MKLVRVARNLFLARIAWRFIARRRDALARERRARRMIAPVLIAGGAGVIWAARARIIAGGGGVGPRDLDRKAGGRDDRESQPDVRKPERVEREQPVRGEGKGAPNRSRGTSAAGTTGHEPKPGTKRRNRSRRGRAQEREKAERKSAHRGGAKVEINEDPELSDVKH